jgi:L-ascorbate metabolism protein UlaG (beta-lactamase superfamily)
MAGTLTFRWLGCAGVELRAGGRSLAVDPFFTRLSIRQFFTGRAVSNRALIAEKLPRCDYVLATHAHHDHIMDIPAVVQRTGAHVYGSENACLLTAAGGAPLENIHRLHFGDHLSLGPFEVDVLPAVHMDTPVDFMIKGPVSLRMKAPLRLLNFRLDEDYSFLIRVEGQRLLLGTAPLAADVYFPIPLNPKLDFPTQLRAVHPRLVIPIHWDDFFRPLSKPVRPSYKLPITSWPPLQRIDLVEFKHMAQESLPGVQVLIPEMFKAYSMRGNFPIIVELP